MAVSEVRAAVLEMYSYIQALAPTADGSDNDNVRILKKIFEVPDDKVKKIAEYMRAREAVIPFTTPNGDDKNDPKMENILAVAAKLGYNPEQKVWVINPDGTAYLSPNKRPVGILYIRRQAQTAMHSAGYADIGNTINTLTGQVTGKSKVTRLSAPEANLIAQYPGMDPVLRELLEFRGGNPKARRVLKHMIASTGTASHDILGAHSETRINNTLKMYMLGAFLNSNHDKTA